jgi:hypothetical protein
MSTMREAVQDAFDSIKGTVDGTVKSVKGTVDETVSGVSDNLDFAGIVERHPWLCIGGFVALGYLGYRLLGASEGGTATPKEALTAEGVSDPWTPPARQTNGRHPPQPEEPKEQKTESTSRPTEWNRVMDEMKALAIGVPMGILRDRLAETGAEAFRTQVIELMNALTEKLGGKIVQESGR